jgi:hypothetical protein
LKYCAGFQRRKIDDRELEMSIEDQKRNIRMLKQAYKKNQISKQLYNVRIEGSVLCLICPSFVRELKN